MYFVVWKKHPVEFNFLFIFISLYFWIEKERIAKDFVNMAEDFWLFGKIVHKEPEHKAHQLDFN